MDNVEIEIIVPAFGAESTLAHCIQAIYRSTGLPSFRVTVVDAGYNGKALEELRSKFPLRCLNLNGVRNAARTRNLGAQAAQAALLVFVDADVAVESEALSRLVAPLRSGAAEAAVGSYSRSAHGRRFIDRYKQLYISAIYTRQAGYLRYEFWSAICCVRTEAFFKVKGFDVGFEGAGGEDTALGIRLTHAGYRIVAIPQAHGTHLHSYTCASLVRNDFKKGLRSMKLMLEGAQPRGANRHATARDMLAVAATVAVAGSLPWAMTTTGAHSAWMVLGFLVLYSVARFDIMRVFLAQGLSFSLGAVTLQFVLDLVRAASAATALILYGPLEKLSSKFFRRAMLRTTHFI